MTFANATILLTTADQRAAFVALIVLVVGAGIPLAFAWARILPEDAPPFKIEPGSFPSVDLEPPAPATKSETRSALHRTPALRHHHISGSIPGNAGSSRFALAGWSNFRRHREFTSHRHSHRSTDRHGPCCLHRRRPPNPHARPAYRCGRTDAAVVAARTDSSNRDAFHELNRRR